MAKIETITVKITYTVGLGGLNVPKEVLKELQDAEGEEIEDDRKYPAAFNWILENIKQRDCYDFRAEVEDITLP